MSSTNSDVNTRLHMRRFMDGIPSADDFNVEDAPKPTAGPGQIVVRTQYVGVDAALRLVMRDSDDFLFRVRPGDLIHATGVGQVIESRNNAFSEGDFVVGPTSVQNYSLSDGTGFEKCDTKLGPPSTWLSGLGIAGLTGYFAMLDVCNVQAGQTVVVNGAAGAVGSLAGQYAKLRGARTIGIAGSDEKCQWLRDAMGYDVAINYRKGDLYENLRQAAPDRVDVIFDNVGGTVLDESLRWIGMHGTVLLCGATSQYVADEITGPRNYIWLGTMRARMQGYVIFDYADRYGEARQQISEWSKSGQLRIAENFFDGGVAEFPAALRALYEGQNKGKMILRLP